MSDFDVQHLVSGFAVYQLPFGKGKRFLSSSKVMDAAIGGWQVSGL